MPHRHGPDRVGLEPDDVDDPIARNGIMADDDGA